MNYEKAAPEILRSSNHSGGRPQSTVRRGMTPKWGFGVAMLLVGALCFYQAHFGRTVLPNRFGRISSTLYVTVFQSLGGHTSARRVAQAMLPPGALFHAGAFALPPCAPKSHMRPLPHLGLSESNHKEYLKNTVRNENVSNQFRKGTILQL